MAELSPISKKKRQRHLEKIKSSPAASHERRVEVLGNGEKKVGKSPLGIAAESPSRKCKHKLVRETDVAAVPSSRHVRSMPGKGVAGREPRLAEGFSKWNSEAELALDGEVEPPAVIVVQRAVRPDAVDVAIFSTKASKRREEARLGQAGLTGSREAGPSQVPALSTKGRGSNSRDKSNGRTGPNGIQPEVQILEPGRDAVAAAVEGEEEEPQMTMKELGVAAWLVRACKEMGITKPTPVQQACIPPILAGADLIGCAQTGSGKTAAFALPILQMLAEDPYGVFALMLTPTRELAIQIADQFRAIGTSMSLRDLVIIGGMEMTAQALSLARRPHVVIATPGRLRDHLRSDPGMAAVFARLRFLVLDEADRLLEAGFEGEMADILAALPRRRQTLLFSATMTANLKQLQDMSITQGQAPPFQYHAYEGLQVVDQLQQDYMFIPANVKDVYLYFVMTQLEELKARSVIVFVSTCKTCQSLHLLLAELGLASAALHSVQSQSHRLAALERFKGAKVPVLVATDVAARGLDIPTVDLVINYDIPRYARDYVHRVGRTARAGRGGRAVSLVTQYDVQLVQSIEKLVGRQLAEYEADEADVLKSITKVYKAKRVAGLKISESGFEQVLADRRAKKLADKGIDPDARRKRRRQQRAGGADGPER